MFSELQALIFDFLRTVPSWALILAALAALSSVLATFRRARLGLVLVGAMLFTASIGVATFDDQYVRPQWLNVMQQARSELFGLFGLLLGLGVFAHVGLNATRRVPAQSVLILIIGLYAAMLRFVHEGPASGAVSVALAVVTIVPLMVLLPRIIDDWEDIVVLLRLVVVVNVIWLLAVVIQAMIDPGAMLVGPQRRFFGPTSNPQHAAIILGMNAAIMIWLFSNDWRRSLRYVYGFLAGVNGIVMLWTGSRVGLVLFVIGLCAVGYGRLGRTVLFLPLGIMGLYLGYLLVGALGVDLAVASRVTSLQDTRTEAWLEMIDAARDNPWVGVGVEGAGSSENSYLYALASYGIGMVLLVSTLALVSLVICLRLFRLRRHVDAGRRAMIDVVLAYNAMYFIGGLVEGYMLARVSANLVLLLIFASIASRIHELVIEESWQEPSEESEPEELDPMLAAGA